MNKRLKKINNWIVLITIELIVLGILVFIMISRMKNADVISVDLGAMASGHEEVKYDGTKWSLNSEDANALVSDGYVIYGPGISLQRGTYTLVLDYSTTRIQKGVVEAASGLLETADYFLLSNNKNTVKYDFRVLADVTGFQFRLKEYYGGNFELNGVTIVKNTHDIRTYIFLFILLSICINLVLFSEKIKSNRYTILAVVGIAFLASLPLFPNGMMTGNDMRFHFARIEAISEGIKNGIFPVKMYSVFNDNYGYPVGIYYGDMLLYIVAIFRIIGFSIITSYKMYIVTMNLLTAISAYLCGKHIFKKQITSLVFSLVFTTATYRMLCIYARAAVGEYSAGCFYPLIILAIWNIYTKEKDSNEFKDSYILLATGMSGLIYTHVLSTEMVVVTLVVLSLALIKKTLRLPVIIVYIKSIFLCGLLSLAFIVPFLEYYINVDTNLDDGFQSTYIQSMGAYISDYFAFFKSITGGDYPGARGLHTPGAVLMFGLAIAVYLIVRKEANKEIKTVTLGALISLFVASNLFPWNRLYEIPKLGQFLVSVQFPYRYIGIAVAFLALLLGLTLERVSELELFAKSLYTYVAAISIIATFVFVSFYQDESFVRSIYRAYDTPDLFVCTRGENFGMYLGSEYLMDNSDVSMEALDYVLNGQDVEAELLEENGLKMKLDVDAKENGYIEVPRFAYPYFVARDSMGERLPVQAGSNNRLKITFKDAYKGLVIVDFEEPIHWRGAEIVSLMAVICLMLLISLRINVFDKILVLKHKA